MHQDLHHLDYHHIHRRLNRWLGFFHQEMRHLDLQLHHGRYLANELDH